MCVGVWTLKPKWHLSDIKKKETLPGNVCLLEPFNHFKIWQTHAFFCILWHGLSSCKHLVLRSISHFYWGLVFFGLPVCLSSVEYDFRQQERRFSEVLNHPARGNSAYSTHLSQPLNLSLLRNAVIKNLTKSKVRSKKLCKTLFKWLPRKIQQM